jgi:hypothetical protein
MIVRGGTDGGARSSENDGERNDKHAIGAQEYVRRFLGHWQSTRFGFRYGVFDYVVTSEWSRPFLKVARVLPAKSRIVK